MRDCPARNYYTVLCVAIFNQQISTKIATILYNRFRSQFPRRRPNPKLVLDFLARPRAGEEMWRSPGRSGAT